MPDHHPTTSKPITARGVLPSLGMVIAEFALVCLLVAVDHLTLCLDTPFLG